MIEPETNGKIPTAGQIKLAKQWMLREKDVKNIIARAMAGAQERVTQAGLDVWRDGGALEPYQRTGEVIDTERQAWKERRYDDSSELQENLKFAPDWDEVLLLGNANANKPALAGEYTEE